MESHFRSIIKALSWRVCATTITFFVSWLLTGEVKLALEIGLVDTVIKLGAYYSHERTWMKISYGRLKAPEYQI